MYPALADFASIQYVAEGNANVIFKLGQPIGIPSESNGDSIGYLDNLEGRLLRLRKDGSPASGIDEAQKVYDTCIRPSFESLGHFLVEQRVVFVSPQQIQKFDAVLRRAETDGSRPAKRRGNFLSEHDYGLVITDMSPRSEDLVLEFKPKWLAQSPTAPPAAKRCRTCALRARQKGRACSDGYVELTFKLQSSDSLRGAGQFCPLNIISTNNSDRDLAVYTIIRASGLSLKSDDINTPTILRKLRIFFWETPLFTALRDLQRKHDEAGPFIETNHSTFENLSVAMALRDCTCFIRIPRGEGPLEVRLGDLDFKPKTKLTHWVQTEKALKEEGWYTGTEVPRYEDSVPCALDHERQNKYDALTRPAMEKIFGPDETVDTI